MPFVEPVPLDEYPDYVTFVARPLCLTDVERLTRDYPTMAHFASDMLLIFDNCRAYNQPVGGGRSLAFFSPPARMVFTYESARARRARKSTRTPMCSRRFSCSSWTNWLSPTFLSLA